MKLNSQEFKVYILNEVKKIAQDEGWNDNLDIISENIIHSLNENEYEIVDPADWSPETTLSEKNTLDKVNSLNEELKRMRELVDFRNPFFDKK